MSLWHNSGDMIKLIFDNLVKFHHLLVLEDPSGKKHPGT